MTRFLKSGPLTQWWDLWLLRAKVQCVSFHYVHITLSVNSRAERWFIISSNFFLTHSWGASLWWVETTVKSGTGFAIELHLLSCRWKWLASLSFKISVDCSADQRPLSCYFVSGVVSLWEASLYFPSACILLPFFCPFMLSTVSHCQSDPWWFSPSLPRQYNFLFVCVPSVDGLVTEKAETASIRRPR